MRSLRLIVGTMVLASLTASCSVTGPVGEAELTIDVPAVTLTSNYRLNGEPFPVSVYEGAFFSLRNPYSGDTVELGWCYDQSHSTMIMPGVYDVVYAYTQGSEVPQHQDAVVMRDVNISSSRALAIDVPAVSWTNSHSKSGS